MEETKTSRAWVLDFGRNLRAACGHHEMWQVLISPKLFSVPCTPFYCDTVLIFQDNILPILDIVSLFEGQKIVQSNRVVGIAIYQEAPNEPIRYVGIHLADMPLSIFVRDDQVCDLSVDLQFQEPLAISCFSHENQAIPIIDFAYLFSEEFNTLQHS
jgi:chemotaxis signal transduction protein